MAIASTSDYKTYAGISGSTYDTRIGVLLTAAQSMMEEYCGRAFESASYVEYIDGCGSDVLIVKNPPITALTYIKVHLTPGDSPTAVDTSLYTYSTDSTGIIRYEPTTTARFAVDSYRDIQGDGFGIYPKFPKGFRSVEVSYTGGYTSGTMPAGVKLALYKIVDSLFAQTRADMSLNSETLGSYSYSRGGAQAFDDTMKVLLKPWARRENL